jgi:hypothetical protein
MYTLAALSWFASAPLRAQSVRVGAAPQPSERQQELFSLRVTGGIGVGHPLFGYRLGLAGEYWLSRIFGLGVQGSFVRQTLVLGEESAHEAAVVVAALRSALGDSHVVTAVGAGYAHVVHTHGSGLCLDLNGNGCSPRPVSRYGGVALAGAIVVLAHVGGSGFSIGPSLRLDVVFDPAGRTKPDGLATIGVELGYSALPGS